MALQQVTSVANKGYMVNDNNDSLKIYSGGGGYSSPLKTSSTTTTSKSSNYTSFDDFKSSKYTNISSNHPLYPGIVGSNSQCSLFPNKPQVYIIDGNKLSGEGATYFNNGKVWHTHTINNKIYELVYYNNTYWYKIKGATAKVSTTNNSALESLLKITEVLKNTLVEENSVQIDETIKEEPVKTVSPVVSYTTTNTTATSYKGKTVLPQNKNIIEVITNNIDIINKQDKKSEINFNDLVSKGKLSFQTKVNVSYSYTYNLVNIVPNPLYNELINNKYNDELYATGDLNGEINTTYLKLNKQNIVNNISKNYYLPSIGELGISMENIQIINDSIDALGEEYSDCKIPYDAIIASSTLYSSTPVTNENYHITNNLNNVWCFNNKEAEITYKPISNKFTIIPFYKFKNNMVINLDEEVEDVVINSIITIELESSNYYEPNSPIHNFKFPNILVKNKATDFNTSNWFDHPFNSKYFFNILFPEVQDYISLGDNFTDLHDDYLSYYIYHSKQYSGEIKDIDNNYNILISESTSKPIYSYYNIEDNTYCQQDIQSNNGILLPSYIINHITEKTYNRETDSINTYQVGKNQITYAYYSSNDGTNNTIYSYNIDVNTSDFWKRYLIYNTIIYNNHMVLMPIIGSGENNYNFKKNKTEVLLYVSIPSSCTDFTCKMNNTTDCNIYVSKYENIKEFAIYCVEFNFKVDTPTDNVLIFSCKYQNQTITKKYFYSIYSLTMSSTLDNKTSTYFNIDNYYVAKDPYYWWQINKWNKLYSNWTSPNYVNYSYHIQNGKSKPYASSYSYIYYDSFGKLFDASYMKTNVKFIAYYYEGNDLAKRFSYATLDNYTKTTYLQSKYSNTFSYLSYSYFNIMYDMSYMINYIGRHIGINNSGTVLERGLRVDRLIDNDVDIKSKKLPMKFDGDILSSDMDPQNNSINYSLYIYNEFKPNHDYHLFTINTYFNNVLYNNSDMINNIMNSEDLIFKPIVRINRTVDDFGIYNDLIFEYLTADIQYINRVNNTQNTKVLVNNFNDDGSYLATGFTIYNDNSTYLNYTYNDPRPLSDIIWNITRPAPGSTGNADIHNNFSLNIPIVGAKQSICFGMDMIEYIKCGMFMKHDENDNITSADYSLNNDKLFYYYNYVFSDYLFLYNNTNGVVTLLMTDPSLSLVSKQHALIQLKPKEWRLYYPNNFNYSVVSNHDIIEGSKIYNIKLVNKTSNIKNIIYDYYKFGELNESFENLKIDSNHSNKLCTQSGFKLVTYLMNLYNNYINNQYTNLDDPYQQFTNFYSEFNDINTEDRKRIYSKETNEINISIKNYNQNKAGHLIVINTNKVMKEDIFYKKNYAYVNIGKFIGKFPFEEESNSPIIGPIIGPSGHQ